MMNVYATTIEHGFLRTSAALGNLRATCEAVFGNHLTAGRAASSDRHFRSLRNVQDTDGTRERD
ncbi:MAG: hypothetical protein P8182_07150 [Deltaproteobacteria bacterium]